MKFTIKKNYITNILKVASNIIKNNNINPLFECILIDVDKVSNTITFIFFNDYFKIKYVLTKDFEILAEGTVLVRFKNLDAVISKLPNEMITFEKIDSNALQVTKTNFESNINILDEKIFSEINFEIDLSWTHFQLNSNLFRTIEKKLSHCCIPKSEKITILNGIYFDSETFEGEINFCSTDSFKAANYKIQFSGPKLKFILDLDLIHFITSNIDENQIIDFYFYNNNLYIKVNDITMIVKIMDGTFPNIYPVFKINEERNSFEIEATKFYEGVEHGNFIVAAEVSSIVKLKIVDKDNLEVSYRSIQVGNSFENLTIENFKGEQFTVPFNSKFLLNSLKAFENHHLKFIYNNANSGICLLDLDDTNFKQLILPLRTE